MRSWVMVLVLWVGPAWAQPALTPDAEIAQGHYQVGLQHYDVGDYPGALAEFELSRSLDPRPELDFNIARCEERLGRWALAAAAYERFLAEKPDAADAAQMRERVKVLHGRADDEQRNADERAAADAAHERVRVRRVRDAAISVGAAAVALAGAGTGAYLSAWSDYHAAQKRCDRQCDASTLSGLSARVSTARETGGLLWGLAGAAAIADVVLIAVDVHRARDMRRLSLRAAR